ncbi:uncharacterized protein ALTATR162_LOCUS8811 [Alternaria atra]|jgi:hypothetical protein|uniref:Uncharacterized protein n=1 Tax=Alternaria atra TaxID=119953 RepID=A0A8J2I7L3_9PLEO|nr:uncharacterized protein ALTATR162_LOCUS8811 [Alternaria atra]CAG5178658.1 unnamed protein product [Alternaria atra]
MVSVYLVVITKASLFSRALYKIVSTTSESQPSTYREKKKCFYLDIRVRHPITKRTMILKMEVLRQDHILNIEVPIRQATLPLAEAALYKRVDAEYADMRLKKESFEMTWTFEEADEVEERYQDVNRKVSADMMARDRRTTWWDVYEFELD